VQDPRGDTLEIDWDLGVYKTPDSAYLNGDNNPAAKLEINDPTGNTAAYAQDGRITWSALGRKSGDAVVATLDDVVLVNAPPVIRGTPYGRLTGGSFSTTLPNDAR
jgi:hypothetical protein